MSKLSEIIKLGIAPGFNTKTTDPTLPQNAVPRAFKELEQTQSASTIARESGFSVKKIKKIWNMLAMLTALLAVQAQAADLTRGVTITTSRLTTSQLHSLIDTATVSTGFYTDATKDVLGTVDSTDYFLLYDVSAGLYKKMTFSTLLLANTDLITTQADDVNPAYNDYVLTYNASATALAKVSMTNLLYNTNLIASLPNITNLTQSATMKVLHGGTNAQIEVTNLWANFKYRAAFTNLVEHTAPTNTDKFLVWDSVANTNKYTTLSGLFTNLTTTTTNGASDWYLTITNGTPKLIPYQNIVNNVSNAIFGVSYTSGTSNLNGLAAGKTMDVAHGLPGTPKIVNGIIVCTSTDAGYAVGDEIDFQGVFDPTTPASTDHRGSFGITAVANSTNIFVVQAASNLLYVRNKTTGAGVDIDESKWSYRVYAKP